MKFGSPKRLSTRTMPAPPAARTRSTFESKVQLPRETSATEPLSDRAGSDEKRGSFGSNPIGAQRRRSTGLPSVPVIVPMSTSD